MKTDQLVTLLASDATLERSNHNLLPILLTGTALLAGATFLAIMGVRPDLLEAWGDPFAVLKQIFPLLLAFSIFGMLNRMRFPGTSQGKWHILAFAVLAVLASAVVFRLTTGTSEQFGAALTDPRFYTCVTSIPLISAPVLAAVLWRMKIGAVTEPGKAALMSGLASGSASATMYAFFCDHDDPIFYAFWYLIAIAVVGFVGWLIGRNVLKW